MKVSEAFPSKYLKSADIGDRQVMVTMKHVQLEKVGDDDHKPVLYFRQGSKGLVLNKTNSKTIDAAYGDEMDDWGGKEIILFSMMVQFRDELVESIRVKVPKAAPAPKPAPQTQDEIDDEIPW